MVKGAATAAICMNGFGARNISSAQFTECHDPLLPIGLKNGLLVECLTKNKSHEKKGTLSINEPDNTPMEGQIEMEVSNDNKRA